MSFIFKCPHCNAMLEQEDAWEGLDSQCAACGKDIHIVKNEAAAPAPFQVPRSSSDSAAFLILAVILLLAAGGVCAYVFRVELGLSSGETIVDRESERQEREKQLRQAAEDAAQKQKEAWERAQKTAAEKENAEKARQQREAKAINEAISKAEKSSADAVLAASKKRQEMQNVNKQIKESEANSIKAKLEAEEYQRNLKQRAAKRIISPENPAVSLPVNWLDTLEVSAANIKGLANCGNNLYMATISGSDIYLQFADNKLVAICYPCDEKTFSEIVAQLHSATGKYGQEYGKLLTQWDIEASSTVVKAQELTIMGLNDYSVWCVYSDYFPVHSQICLDNIVAAAAKTGNFIIAKEGISTAIDSYVSAFAREQTREIVSKLTAAENKWSDNLKSSLYSEFVNSTDSRDIDDVIESVISEYKYPGSNSGYSPR